MSLSLGEKLLAFAARMSDRWLGTHLAERILARYDARIAELKDDLARIEFARGQLEASIEAMVLSTCAALLAVFDQSPEGGILFEPDTEYESLLQTAINVLVKPGLATIREHDRPGGQFAYEIFPRWIDICEHLSHLSERVGSPDLAARIRQNITQIQTLLNIPPPPVANATGEPDSSD